eukprot:GAHX01000032.1.p1 GENE.GAHX01000032.1~~GAHX01000032.1.p1  ORF type:complete len:240 (+),score=41.22 GAHX01000032.1:71-790(+)
MTTEDLEMTITTSDLHLKSKAVFLGDVAVGKTSLINRYVTGTFVDGYTSTVGIDFANKTKEVIHEGEGPNEGEGGFPSKIRYKTSLQLWDTAGQERFKSLLPNYIREADIVVLVFSLDNLKSFENIAIWMNKIQDFGDKMIFLVCNKQDLETTTAKEVGKEIMEEVLISQFITSRNIKHYFRTSAKDNFGICDLFDNLFKHACKIALLKNQKLDEQKKAENQRIDVEEGGSILTSCCWK